MRPLLYVLSFLAVLGLGFWAYRENYTTQSALRDVADLQEIMAIRSELGELIDWFGRDDDLVASISLNRIDGCKGILLIVLEDQVIFYRV